MHKAKGRTIYTLFCVRSIDVIHVNMSKQCNLGFFFVFRVIIAYLKKVGWYVIFVGPREPCSAPFIFHICLWWFFYEKIESLHIESRNT